MRLLMAISLAFAALVGACSVTNPNHCANLQGDATCDARGGGTPFCSKCVADNNGCVADPVDAACDAGSTTNPPGTSTTSPTSSTTTTGTVLSSSTSTAETTTTGTTTTGDSSTSTSTGETTSTSSTTGQETTGTSSTGTTIVDTTETTLADTSTGTTDATTTGEPMCGNDIQEGSEVCDGTDLGGFNCVTKDSQKFSGGTLNCSNKCDSFDDSACCLASGQDCGGNVVQECCSGDCGLLPMTCG